MHDEYQLSYAKVPQHLFCYFHNSLLHVLIKDNFINITTWVLYISIQYFLCFNGIYNSYNIRSIDALDRLTFITLTNVSEHRINQHININTLYNQIFRLFFLVVNL